MMWGVENVIIQALEMEHLLVSCCIFCASKLGLYDKIKMALYDKNVAAYNVTHHSHAPHITDVS